MVMQIKHLVLLYEFTSCRLRYQLKQLKSNTFQKLVRVKPHHSLTTTFMTDMFKQIKSYY